MTEWEAMYKALAVGASDESVVAAEKLVRIAMDFGHSGLYPPKYALEMMLRATAIAENRSAKERLDALIIGS